MFLDKTYSLRTFVSCFARTSPIRRECLLMQSRRSSLRFFVSLFSQVRMRNNSKYTPSPSIFRPTNKHSERNHCIMLYWYTSQCMGRGNLHMLHGLWPPGRSSANTDDGCSCLSFLFQRMVAHRKKTVTTMCRYIV